MNVIEVIRQNWVSAACHQADEQITLALSSGSTFRGDYQHHLTLSINTEDNSVVFRDETGKIVDSKILLSLFT